MILQNKIIVPVERILVNKITSALGDSLKEKNGGDRAR